MKTLKELESQSTKSSSESFYISFTDLMLLLGVFFVMLLGASGIDRGTFDQLRFGLTGKSEGTLIELANQIKETAKDLKEVSVSLDDDGVRLDFESAALFSAGKANLKHEFLMPISNLFKQIGESPYKIEIEGHTEDRKFFKKVGNEIQTNWSLSGRRASAMADFLQHLGVDPKKMRVVGYGYTRPKIPIEGLDEDALKIARAKNRRVTILIY